MEYRLRTTAHGITSVRVPPLSTNGHLRRKIDRCPLKMVASNRVHSWHNSDERVLLTLPNAHLGGKIERCRLANQRLIRATVWQRSQSPSLPLKRRDLAALPTVLSRLPGTGIYAPNRPDAGFDPHPWLAAPNENPHTVPNAHFAGESLRLGVSESGTFCPACSRTSRDDSLGFGAMSRPDSRAGYSAVPRHNFIRAQIGHFRGPFREGKP